MAGACGSAGAGSGSGTTWRCLRPRGAVSAMTGSSPDGRHPLRAGLTYGPAHPGRCCASPEGGGPTKPRPAPARHRGPGRPPGRPSRQLAHRPSCTQPSRARRPTATNWSPSRAPAWPGPRPSSTRPPRRSATPEAAYPRRRGPAAPAPVMIFPGRRWRVGGASVATRPRPCPTAADSWFSLVEETAWPPRRRAGPGCPGRARPAGRSSMGDDASAPPRWLPTGGACSEVLATTSGARPCG